MHKWSPFKMRPTLLPLLWSFILLFVSLYQADAQQGIPAGQLAKVKAATVLVLVDTPDEAASGSGFLMYKEGNYGYIATNEHVVDTETKAGRTVQVVFNSGIPGQEMVKNAEVIGEDEFRDLAILRVDAKSVPEPLKLASSQPVHETMPVWVFGFPFGEMLATSKLHPSITITTGTVTSLRLNDFGEVARVQVDADINEGNSGGPIVDATGGLVGIATEKIEDTKIGLGLPPSELERMLQGRVSQSGMHPISNADGKSTYRAVVVLIDPLRQVRSVTVYFAPAAQLRGLQPKADGRFEKMTPDAQEFRLALDGNEYNGTTILENSPTTNTVYAEQIRLELADGQFQWTQPVPVVVPAAPRPNPGAGQPAKGGGDDWLGGATAPPTTPGAGGGGAAAGTPNAGGPDPIPVVSNRLLLDKEQKEAGATFHTVNVGGGVTPTMAWSVDGKSVYFLEGSGVVHRVTVPEFREVAVLQTQQKTSFMVLTHSGLVVGCPDAQEIWLLDAGTLAVRKRIRIGKIMGLTGSPVLDRAYVRVSADVMSVVDLAAGTVIKQWKAKEYNLPGGHFGGNLGDFNYATVTSDGQYLISGDDNLNRLRIKDDDLIYEEDSAEIGMNRNPLRIVVSADSRYVALIAGGGNASVPEYPPVGPYTTYVYKITDLKTPILNIVSGAYPCAMGFDKVAARIYANRAGQILLVFNTAGNKEQEFNLGFNMYERPDQILVHPQGHKVLLLSSGRVVWVELPVPAQ